MTRARNKYQSKPFVPLLLQSAGLDSQAPLDLVKVCKTFPGLSHISGNIYRRSTFHNRDVDFGTLACRPELLRWWYEPVPKAEGVREAWPGCR